MKQRNLQGRHLQRGLASIEFVLVAPILIVLIYAISEFGWALHQYNTLTRAARDGARHAAGHSLVGSLGMVILSHELTQETRNIVVFGNPVGSGTPLLPELTVNDVTVSAVDVDYVQVTTIYQYRPIFGQIPLFGPQGSFPINLEMAGTVLMRAI